MIGIRNASGLKDLRKGKALDAIFVMNLPTDKRSIVSAYGKGYGQAFMTAMTKRRKGQIGQRSARVKIGGGAKTERIVTMIVLAQDFR